MQRTGEQEMVCKHQVSGWDQLGSSDEGGNVCVSHRATAIKCAKEQLRVTSPAEREMRETDEDWRRRP